MRGFFDIFNFLANKIYVSSRYSIKPTFNEVASGKFQSTAESVDFGRPSDTAKIINRWIEGATNGVLKDVVKPTSINGDTKMLLLNAIYFKGTWVNGFNLNKNPRYQRNFFKAENNKIKLDFMETDEKKFNYGESDELKAEIVELPYTNSQVKMFILLPNHETTVIDLERKLDASKVDKLIKSMRPRDATVAMPKVKLDSDASFNAQLKEVKN